MKLAKRMVGLFIGLVGCCLHAAAAEPPQVIKLWPEGVPGLHADAAEEQVVNGRIVHVHYPSVTVYAPDPARANGTAVIYAPGGGYVRIAAGENGGPETKWLNSLGVTVFLLKYRLDDYGHPAPLQDMLRAIRTVRARAAEFGVRPDRIGVMGGSAGGHLSGCAATMWDAPEGKTGAALDAVSARPDFAILIYPVVTMTDPFVHQGSRRALLGKSPSAEQIAALSLEQHVRKDMPPVFLAATEADRSVPVENSLRLYQALRDAGVPAEMHVYAQGSHGNSLDPQYGPTAFWPQRAEEWLRFNGWLTRENTKAAGVHRDIEYGRAGDVSLKLDASVPAGEGPFPVAILVHGGGWSGGDKAGSDKPGSSADVTPWFGMLTEAKFTWFSVNYRMAPAHRWPACFEDVQTAIRWVKAHAAEFKGDPQRIVIFGHSAGGHLATLAGVLGEGGTRVQAVVGYAPVTDFEYELPARGGLSQSLQWLHDKPKEVSPESLAILRDTAPINHVKPGLPPFLLVQGDADKTVPIQENLNFQQKLREAGNTCDLIVLPGAPHGLLTWEKFLPDYKARVVDWLRLQLGDAKK